jgi:hypothetical protein
LQLAARIAKWNGDAVRVAVGVYTSAQDEAVLDLEGSDWDVVIEGGYSPDFSVRNPKRWPTVIDGQRTRRGLRLDKGAKLDISGVTITRGFGQWGGGVHVRMSQFSATDCVISDNASTNGVDSYGGGVYCTLGSTVRVASSLIVSNTAADGGAFQAVSSGTTLDVIHCRVVGNVATISGGGTRYDGGVRSTVAGCVFAGNQARYIGGGISVGPFGDVSLHRATIAWNQVTDTVIVEPDSQGGGGIAVAGVVSTATLSLRHCVVVGNIAVVGNDMRCGDVSVVQASHCNIGDIYGTMHTSSNIISVDPMFADPANGDFHLLYGSPCIDAGSTNTGASLDMDGESRPFGGAMDMGADEFVDADSDNMADYWEVASYGDISTTEGTEDTDGDALSTFGEYMQQTDPHDSDSDSDLAQDGWEVAQGYDPKDRDMDDDGMWDGWEATHNLNAFTNDASLNPDGDPHDNLSEFTADTDPNDATSHLKLLAIAPLWGGTRLDWQGGRDSYQWLESCSNLTSNDWRTIFVIPPPTPTNNAVIVFDARPTQFYRVRVERE